MRHDKPLLMKGPLVVSTMAGIKTETRRILKNSTEHDGPYNPAYVEQYKNHAGWADICPYGQPGDLLWIRETWQGFRQINIEYDEWEELESTKDLDKEPYEPVYKCDNKNFPDKWQPSIFMPRKFSRLTLEILSVGVERIQDITPAGVRAEGVTVPVNEKTGGLLLDTGGKFSPINYLAKETKAAISAGEGWDHADNIFRSHFASLWDNINYKRKAGWFKNPFVWVIKYTPHLMNIDTFLKQESEHGRAA